LKEKYINLCAVEQSIPIFSRSWWLDAVTEGHEWDVALVESGGVIQAAMPYVRKNGKIFNGIVQPTLTQTLGPWFQNKQSKYTTLLENQKRMMNDLILQLPNFDYFSQQWHHSQTNWLPFFWAGFNQTTRYTYILPELSDEEVLWKNMRENIRGDIRKATKRFSLQVRDDLSIDEFLEINKKTFSRQGVDVPYSDDFIRRIDDACKTHDCRKIFIAEDEDGRHHAGVYIVWDQNSAYYLMGGADPELRKSGATSLCLWQAIKFSAKVTKSFNFEGSMMEPIERFVRAFGAIQTPYYRITKTPSRMFQAFQKYRSLKKRFL
jgi:hypothetical protein